MKFWSKEPLVSIIYSMSGITRQVFILRLQSNIDYNLILDKITKRPDFEATAHAMVGAFRKGKFGRVMLDDDLI